MTDLKTLTKPQWDAANAAAKIIMEGNINNLDDRIAYRTARMDLAVLLPDGVSAAEVIHDTIHRRMLDSISKVVETTDGFVIIFGGEKL